VRRGLEHRAQRFVGLCADTRASSPLAQMLRQGFSADTADYDGRTALMLACVKGHMDVIDMLLHADCDPSLKDNLGGTALAEACKHGYEDAIHLLREAGAE
jgi:uncharacterized protein